MDAITRAYLDEWFAQHATGCGVHCFDVALQRYDTRTRVVLVCPTCLGTLGGIIADTEMPTIARSLLRVPGGWRCFDSMESRALVEERAGATERRTCHDAGKPTVALQMTEVLRANV